VGTLNWAETPVKLEPAGGDSMTAPAQFEL